MDRIQHYEVLGELARGGMGVVFRAYDPRLEREVAIKVLLRATGNERSRKRFLREVRALGRLQHPHVVRVHHAGEHQGAPYLVMDLIEGSSLGALLRRQGPLEPRQAAELVAKVARALQHAHDQGVLHRDVKPDNVLLHLDEPLLTDFGLAKWLDPDDHTQLSRSGVFLGTPGFMPPEQATGKLSAIDARADVFGAGALLYATLTGRPPYVEETLFALVAALERPASSVRELRPDVPEALAAIVARCLQRQPSDRFPTAAALAEALEQWSSDPPAPARSRRSSLVGAVALTALLGVGALLGLRTSPPEAPSPAPSGSRATEPEQEANQLLLSALEEGEFTALLVAGERLDPETVARIAAWSDDRAALTQALDRLPSPRRRALAWELRRFVPEVEPPAGPLLLEGDDPWEAIACGEACLAQGLVSPAAVAFEQADELANRDAAVLLAAQSGLIRVAVARGDEDAARARIADALTTGPGPLAEIGLLAWDLVLEGADPQAAFERAPGHSALATARHHREWRTGERPAADALQPLVIRLRAAVSQGDEEAVSAMLKRLGVRRLKGSWVRTERELCRRGLDGAAGLRLARAADLASAALAGQDYYAGEESAALLREVVGQRPNSALLWHALSQCALARRDYPEAFGHAERARFVSPQDPSVQILFGRVMWGELIHDLGRADDSSLEAERARAVRYETVISAFAAARDAAPQGDPLNREARLGIAKTALLARERLLVRGAGDELTDPPLRELRSALEPLLEGMDLAKFTASRAALTEAVEARDATNSLRLARVLQTRAPSQPWQLRRTLTALLLLAHAGGEDAPAAAGVYAALVGDLPARAIAIWRGGERGNLLQRRAALTDALRIQPGSPDFLYQRACLALWPESAQAFAATLGDYQDLGQVVARSPERALAVSDLLERVGGVLEREGLAGQLAKTQAPERTAELLLARALISLRRASSLASPAEALLAHRDAREAATLDPESHGARLLAARALERALRLDDDDLREDLVVGLRPVDLSAPWLAGSALLRLPYVEDWPQRHALIDRLLGLGYLSRPDLIPDRSAPRGRSADESQLPQVLAWLREVFLERDLTDVDDVAALASALSAVRRGDGAYFPFATALLRVGAGPHLNEVLNSRGLEELLAQLPPHLEPRYRSLHARGPDRDTPDRDLEHARALAWAARDGLRETEPLLLPPERLRPLGVRATVRAPIQVELEDRAIPPDRVLAELAQRVYAPYAPLEFLIAQGAPAGGPLLEREDLSLPWSRSRALLATLHLGAYHELTTDWLADQGAWREARRVIERSAVFNPREAPDEVVAEEGVGELLERSPLGAQQPVLFGTQLRVLGNLGARLPQSDASYTQANRLLSIAGELWLAAHVADPQQAGAHRQAAAEAAAKVQLSHSPAPDSRVRLEWYRWAARVGGEADRATLTDEAAALAKTWAACDPVNQSRVRPLVASTPFLAESRAAAGSLLDDMLPE